MKKPCHMKKRRGNCEICTSQIDVKQKGVRLMTPQKEVLSRRQPMVLSLNFLSFFIIFFIFALFLLYFLFFIPLNFYMSFVGRNSMEWVWGGSLIDNLVKNNFSLTPRCGELHHEVVTFQKPISRISSNYHDVVDSPWRVDDLTTVNIRVLFVTIRPFVHFSTYHSSRRATFPTKNSSLLLFISCLFHKGTIFNLSS